MKPYQLFNFTIPFEYIQHASEYAQNASEYIKRATEASHLKPYQLFNFTIAFEYRRNASEYAEHASEYVKRCHEGFSLEALQFSCSIIGAPWTPEFSPEGFSLETLSVQSVQLFDYRSPLDARIHARRLPT